MGEHRPTRRQLLQGAAAMPALAAAPIVADIPLRSGTWRHYVDTSRGQVHVTTAALATAARRRPIVCFHPSPTTGDMYRDLQRELAGDRVVHCPDTPGYGMSDPPAAKPTIQDYGATLAEAVATLASSSAPTDGRVDLFGFHTGSLCALEVALQRPGLVHRVVLSGIPHFAPEERARKRRENVPGYPYFTDREYVGRLFQRLVLDARDSGTDAQRLTRFGDRLRAGPDGWWGPDAVFTYDSVAALPRLAQPTLVIAFDEEMTEPTRQAARLIPNAQLVEMLDLPIFGFIVAPARVANAIRTFVDPSGSPA